MSWRYKMNYNLLTKELVEDPLEVGYKNMNAYEIRDSLNAKTRVFYNPLTSNDLLKWSGVNGRYIKVKKAAEDTNLSDEVRSAAIAAMVMVDRDNTVFDFNDHTSQQIVNTLVNQGVVSQEDKDDLISLLSETQTRAQELGLPVLRKKDIEKAQNGSK